MKVDRFRKLISETPGIVVGASCMRVPLSCNYPYISIIAGIAVALALGKRNSPHSETEEIVIVVTNC